MFADWSKSACAVIVLYCNIFNIVKKNVIMSYRRYYPIICSILPVTAAIIVVSVDGVETLIATGVSICFAAVDPEWVQYTVFFTPSLCVILLTLFVAISIALRTWEVFSRTSLKPMTSQQSIESDEKEVDSPRSSSGENAPTFRSLSSLKQILKYNSKIVTLALAYTGCHIYFFYFRVAGSIREDDFTASGKRFVECLLTNSLSSVKDGTDACGLHVDDRFSLAELVMVLRLFGGYRTVTFLTFGLVFQTLR